LLEDLRAEVKEELWGEEHSEDRFHAEDDPTRPTGIILPDLFNA
jgi:hypothetical protein